MKIEFVEIQNFRKLKACRVDLANKETVFVGANNSGKTSAMDALILFLKERLKFSTRDFTLSNWKGINDIGKAWLKENDDALPDLSIQKWAEFLPQLDVWIRVKNDEIHYVSHLIPTLDWKDGLIGIGLRFEPKNVESLYKEFHLAFTSARAAKSKVQNQEPDRHKSLKIWPTTMWDFLERKLQQHFEVKAYILDPEKLKEPECALARPQIISPESLPLDHAPFTGLIKIDIINAQRGFSDPNSEQANTTKTTGNLSAQLREYYAKHLDPLEQTSLPDLDALAAIEDAKSSFDNRLKESFSVSLKELETLNYPGFGGNPSINISSKINAVDGLNHASAVQFNLLTPETIDCDYPLSLPEKYNGLGYQNLISMVFKLIRFRDEWMQVGNSATQLSENDKEDGFEPLHLVLVEEPEAHLHAQVQQVFIRKAYEVLRNHPLLKGTTNFTSQLVVSTHSNHIAHEIDFTSLRYFRRKIADAGKVPTSCIVNLSKTFGTETETTKFAIRYLRTTHCDLFFADAVILVEGPAEKMLIPHFIKNHYPDLASCYISILEIGGSHAHKLKPLIEDLGIVTLIVTDIDSIDPKNNRASVLPEKGKGYETNNYTMSSWIPGVKDFDALLQLTGGAKESKDYPIKVVYQTPVEVNFKTDNSAQTETQIPYTFEDTLVLENLKLFRKLTGVGLLNKFNKAANKTDGKIACGEMFDALKTGKKAEFALELLFQEEPANLQVPKYICDGLTWLRTQLLSKNYITLIPEPL